MSAFPRDFAGLLPDNVLRLTRLTACLARPDRDHLAEGIQDLELQIEDFSVISKSLCRSAEDWLAFLRTGGGDIPTAELTAIARALETAEAKQAAESGCDLARLEEVSARIGAAYPDLAEEMLRMVASFTESRVVLLKTVQEVRWAAILAADARDPTGPIERILATPDDVRAMFAELDEPA
jgi:hypothetical protein